MNLINEEYTRHDLSTTLFSPLSYFLVNLLSNFGLDFTNITGKEGKESLSSAIYNIDFVQGNGMNDLLSLLQLSLGALHKSGLRANVIIVTASRE